MTNQELLLFIVGLILCMLLVMMLTSDWKNQSDVHSKMPAPEPKPEPVPKAYGPLFLHIQFYYHVDVPQRPDIYLRADDIKSVIGDCRNSILTIENGMETLKFEDVEQYSFVKMSQMGDYLFEEEL